MTTDADIEARLVALEAASDARRGELRSLLDDLPHAVSRRALVVEAVRDLRRAPANSRIGKWAVAKPGRITAAVARRVRGA